jgi:hypothetical protein
LLISTNSNLVIKTIDTELMLLFVSQRNFIYKPCIIPNARIPLLNVILNVLNINTIIMQTRTTQKCFACKLQIQEHHTRKARQVSCCRQTPWIYCLTCLTMEHTAEQHETILLLGDAACCPFCRVKHDFRYYQNTAKKWDA